MCVYLYARNSMIDIDDVFNRLSYINYSYQKHPKPIKMVWVLFHVIKHKKDGAGLRHPGVLCS